MSDIDKTKCIVHECVNHKHEGQFVGEICKPCYIMLTTGKELDSFNFIASLRNSRDKWRECAENLATCLRASSDWATFGVYVNSHAWLGKFDHLKEEIK